jgi:hypothetical protein
LFALGLGAVAAIVTMTVFGRVVLREARQRFWLLAGPARLVFSRQVGHCLRTRLGLERFPLLALAIDVSP